MTLNLETLPEFIARGIQGLAYLDFVEVVKDSILLVDDDYELELIIALEKSSAFVPKNPRFVVKLSKDYPGGSIEFFPASVESLEVTFPHQELNVVAEHRRFRLGKLCLENPVSRLSRIGDGNDPVRNPDERLAWYACRAKKWLENAIDTSLMNEGEPFEVPHVKFQKEDRIRIVHDEGVDSFEVWEQQVGSIGTIEWGAIQGVENTCFAAKFLDRKGECLRGFRGQVVSDQKEQWVGSWWLWPQPLVKVPWQVPSNWGELREVGKAVGVDVDAGLQVLWKRHRGKKPAFLLVGYPIPVKWGQAASEIYWQGLYFPRIPENITPRNGFPKNDKGRWLTLRMNKFSSKNKIDFVRTLNWHPDRLQARGRFDPTLRQKTIYIVGVGALGAALADILVRGGCGRVTVIDGDCLEAGNLVRHVLTAGEIGKSKSEALGHRLRLASPSANIQAVKKHLGREENDVWKLLEDAEVVCDCTADNEVVRMLSEPTWSVPKVFLSASMGFAAKHLFLFHALGCSFPGKEFLEEVEPWIEDERQSWEKAGETFEGTGCYSPLFPARNDDVWLAAVTTAKHLEHVLCQEPHEHFKLTVFQQIENGAGFSCKTERDMGQTEGSPG